ncbi:hypothetical protein HF521_010067 [Silurus meridionalis]|uniref:Glutathione peroxidase 4 n=1 Tax=Silurus meridionalis TaxID=175797 RepID=A0A8T0AL63_SILME|nr:hypothetical protein HF521_010067 [Silurus meridionalis]
MVPVAKEGVVCRVVGVAKGAVRPTDVHDTMWLWNRALVLAVLGSRTLSRAMCAQASDWKKAKSIYEFSAIDIDGNEVSLEKYRGFVCIITNVASK